MQKLYIHQYGYKYRELKEGYWTSTKFINQIEMVVLIAEVKYQKDGW